MTTLPKFWADVHSCETVEAYCREFYSHARRSGRLYVDSEGNLMVVDVRQGPRRVLSVDEFGSLVPSIVDVRKKGEKGKDYPTLLPRQEYAAIFASRERYTLPAVRSVVFEPVVVPERGSYRCIDRPGYDEPSGVFYWRRDGDSPIRMREGVDHLSRCFSGVPFQAEGDRSNVIAWLLGSIVLDPRMSSPMLVVTGNDRGVGKSSLVQAAGVILTGSIQSPVQPSGGEFIKQVSARFLENGRFLPLDNVVTSQGQAFRSPNLARLLTEGWSKRVRVLGQSRSVAQSGVLFALTINSCSLDTDLATRSLMVRLYKEKPSPMIPYCLEYAFDHREEIYGELLWLASQEPTSDAENVHREFRFRTWLRFVWPRVTSFYAPLSISEAQQFDSRVQELIAYAEDHVGKPFTAHDLYKHILSRAQEFEGLCEFVFSARGERGHIRRLGSYLSNQVGETLSFEPGQSFRLLEAESSAREGKKFVFEEI